MLKLIIFKFQVSQNFYTLNFTGTEQIKNIKVTALPYSTFKISHVEVTKPFHFQIRKKCSVEIKI